MRYASDKVRAYVKRELGDVTLAQIIDNPFARARELLLLQDFDRWTETNGANLNDLGSFIEAAKVTLMMPRGIDPRYPERDPKQNEKTPPETEQKPKTPWEIFEAEQAAATKGKTYAWDVFKDQQ